MALSTGTTYAAKTILIDGAKIKNNSLTGLDIKNGSLGEPDLSVALRSKINDDSCDPDNGSGNDGKCQGTQGDPGAQGPKGDKGDPGAQGSKGDKGDTGPAGGGLQAPIPSGQTVTGGWGDTRWNGSTLYVSYDVPLPAPAPVALTEATVNFAASSPLAADGDATCTGSAAIPTAPAGKLCIYVDNWSSPGGTTEARGYPSKAPKHGFNINLGGTANTLIGGWGSWAYTAP